MIDTFMTFYPTCPLCGFEDKKDLELPFGGLEGTITTECKGCKVHYQAERILVMRYKTEKLKREPVE